MLRGQGLTIILAGILVTAIPMLLAFAVAKYFYGFGLDESLGAVCGSMTSTPGLGVLCAT